MLIYWHSMSEGVSRVRWHTYHHARAAGKDCEASGGLRTIQRDGDVVSSTTVNISLRCPVRGAVPDPGTKKQEPVIRHPARGFAVLPVNDLPAIICSDQRDSSGTFLVVDDCSDVALKAFIRLFDTVVFFDGV